MNVALIGPASPPDLHVMTFNVRRRLERLAWRSSDRWSVRRPRLAALLRLERPTVLGVQEALPDQASDVLEALGSSYRYVGHGRQPGPRGEGCPVYYDTERLELRDWRQVPLSERPDEPGSTSWGSVFPRIYVRATFRDRATSAEFVIVNTHLDAFSPRARLRGAQALHRLVTTESRPAVVLGDLNAGPSAPPWDALRFDGRLADAWTIADTRLTPEWATYNRYREPRPGRRIDGILVTSELEVRAIGINAARFGGGWPSDHLPVQAVLRMPAPAAPVSAPASAPDEEL